MTENYQLLANAAQSFEEIGPQSKKLLHDWAAALAKYAGHLSGDVKQSKEWQSELEFIFAKADCADNITAFAMAETLLDIFTSTLPEKIAANFHEFRSKGGRSRAKQKTYNAWKLWRQMALKEAKKVLRKEGEISQSKV